MDEFPTTQFAGGYDGMNSGRGNFVKRPIKIGLWSISGLILGLFVIGLGFSVWQYREAAKLLEVTRDFEVGKEMTPDQLKRMDAQWCGTRDFSQNPNQPGTQDLIFRCQVLHLNRSGFAATTELHLDLTLRDHRLVHKSAILFYDGVPYFGSRGIAIIQKERSYGYQGTPEESIPNRRVEGTRFMDGSYKGFFITDDDTVSAKQRKMDWNLNLRCMWTERACLSFIAAEVAKRYPQPQW
jgi:hypothetical protein